MWLLVNNQLTRIAIQPKNTSLEQICYRRSQGIALTSLHCLLYSTLKNKDLKRISNKATNVSLRQKCPNAEFFVVRIFSHSHWIRRDTEYLSVFSRNAGKYRSEKTPYLNTFHAVVVLAFIFLWTSNFIFSF